MSVLPPLSVARCRFLRVRGAVDPRGSVHFVETGLDLDFAIKRVFFIHGVPAGQSRGHHGHREVSLVLVAAAGGCAVVLDDGTRREKVRLERPDLGLLVGPWVWHELEDFAAGTVVLALASGLYDEADYIRDHAVFRAEIGAQRR